MVLKETGKLLVGEMWYKDLSTASIMCALQMADTDDRRRNHQEDHAYACSPGHGIKYVMAVDDDEDLGDADAAPDGVSPTSCQPDSLGILAALHHCAAWQLLGPCCIWPTCAAFTGIYLP